MAAQSRFSRFYMELKRRRVMRVAAVYAVAAWLLLQVGQTVLSILEMPAWTAKLLLVLLALGFPLAVVLGWVFDITPDGVERTPRGRGRKASAAPPARKLDFRFLVYVTAGVVMVLLAVGTFGRMSAGGERSAGKKPESGPSIAVLPFINMSSDAEQEYFSDGITEEILNALAQVPGLHVAARTSSFSFKGKSIPVGDIGAQLNVGTVLEGSVRKAGSQVRITAQLINTSDGYHLWSQTYDRKLDDVFAIQEEISRSIVQALRIRLAASAPVAASGGTSNTAAHDLYLRGLQQINRRRSASLARAATYFEQATREDAAYAQAFAMHAQAMALMPQYSASQLTFEEAARRGRASAERALELDPSSAEAHAALGQIAQELEWKWDEAETHYRRAIEANEVYAPAHQWYAELHWFRRRFDKGIEESERALALDPLSLILNNAMGVSWFYDRQYDKAIEQFRRALELDPGFGVSWDNLLNTYLVTGRFEEARSTARAWQAQSAEIDISVLLHVIDAVEDPTRASAARAAIRATGGTPGRRWGSSQTSGAVVHLLMVGDTAGALDALDARITDHEQGIHSVVAMPQFDGMRSNPRFRALLGRMGLE